MARARALWPTEAGAEACGIAHLCAAIADDGLDGAAELAVLTGLAAHGQELGRSLADSPAHEAGQAAGFMVWSTRSSPLNWAGLTMAVTGLVLISAGCCGVQSVRGAPPCPSSTMPST